MAGTKERAGILQVLKSLPKRQKQNTKSKSLGDHIFVKVSGGVGLRVDAKVGAVKVEAEVAEKCREWRDCLALGKGTMVAEPKSF